MVCVMRTGVCGNVRIVLTLVEALGACGGALGGLLVVAAEDAG